MKSKTISLTFPSIALAVILVAVGLFTGITGLWIAGIVLLALPIVIRLVIALVLMAYGLTGIARIRISERLKYGKDGAAERRTTDLHINRLFRS